MNNGNIESTGSYEGGWQFQYYNNGKIKEKKLQFHDIRRKYQQWNEDGTQVTDWNFDQQGNEQGEQRTWFEGGKLESEYIYQHGKVINYKKWDSDEKLIDECSIKTQKDCS